MDTKIEVKEEPVSDLILENKMDFVKESRTNTNLCNDKENDNKMEIKVEPCLEGMPREIKCEAEDPPISDADLDNNTTEYFPPELVLCKSNTGINTDFKTEIKEESWCSEGKPAEITLESDISVQSSNENAVAGIEKYLPSSDSQRLYPQDFNNSSGPSEILAGAGLQEVRENNITCEKDSTINHKNEFIGATYAEKHLDSSMLEQTGESSTSVLDFTEHSLFCASKKAYQCEICDKGFDQIAHLKAHMLNHEYKKVHKCEICDKTFNHISHIMMHKLTHVGKKPFKCDVCDTSFLYRCHLERHSLTHKEKRPFKCEHCDKSFTQLSNLTSHNWIHKGEKPHKCETCEKTFTRLSHLKAHNVIHEGEKPFKCRICEKSYIQMSSLKAHSLMHEGKKPFTCDICDKSFTQMSSLKTHKMIHEGKKPHKCETCDKSFTQLSHLKTHQLTHEGIRPYKCDICSKSFTRMSNLRTHRCVPEARQTI